MFDRRQYNILSERYFESLLGDFTSLVWMVGQAPLIAGLIILRWRSLPATETLYFVISLSAVWFGCINACREIAREAPIYRRERLFGLNAGAYLASKVKVLGIIGLLEIGLFYGILDYYLALNLRLIPGITGTVVMYAAGICLGLLISRWSGSVSKAVVSVPIAIIPQIVFSKFVLPRGSLKGAAARIDAVMPARWGLDILNASRTGQFAAADYATAMAVLTGIAAAFLILTGIHFWLTGDE